MMLPSVFGENLFDDVFDDFWGFPSFDDKAMRKAERKLYGHHAAKMMKTDVQEHDDHYEVDIDLPGFKKDEKEKETGKFVRQERYAGSMSRSFYIGENVKEDDIHAKYESGVLKINIPKEEAKEPEAEKKKYIAIEG